MSERALSRNLGPSGPSKASRKPIQKSLPREESRLPFKGRVLQEKIFDPFRKKWVKKRPEELVRLALLHKMIHELSYPLSHIAIEIALTTLPHLTNLKNIPNRRLDIVVFSKDIHPTYPLFPLLLIECKIDPITPDHLHQALGYNDIVKAPFLALANQTDILTAHYDTSTRRFTFLPTLPSYNELRAALTK